jgi:hypothetical protein
MNNNYSHIYILMEYHFFVMNIFATIKIMDFLSIPLCN